MKLTPSLVLDLILAVVFVGAVLSARRQGFASTLVRLVGSLASLFCAYFVSDRLSPEVFERFFRSGLIHRTSDVLASGGQMTIQAVVDKLAAFLPQSLVEQLLGGADKLSELLDTSTPDIAEQVVENVIAPLFLPIISVVVFFATFAVCAALIRLVAALLSNLNHIPVLGGANRLLGTVLGFGLGAVYLVVLLCAVWALIVVTGNQLSWLSTSALENSFFYGIFAGYNPFG